MTNNIWLTFDETGIQYYLISCPVAPSDIAGDGWFKDKKWYTAPAYFDHTKNKCKIDKDGNITILSDDEMTEFNKNYTYYVAFDKYGFQKTYLEKGDVIENHPDFVWYPAPAGFSPNNQVCRLKNGEISVLGNSDFLKTKKRILRDKTKIGKLINVITSVF